ncbi:glycosyltransferase family 1 protein [Sphingomonas oleivorans]|uniref:Glycosyltransferase family 1 protein n=1 Tax=Sphingomonas oleivorans TaxID=1735121 RepID=A0A2T5G1W1_9SPHN|nr:glycosyltransferase [Sphingomonas oleivorans]PTQ13136.1 glycosyltransferase family 1 protein [Sphingomonas oleivorans]
MGRPLTIVHVITRLLRAGAEENTWSSCVHQARSGHRVHLFYGAESNPDYYERQGTDVRLQLIPSLVRPIHPLKDVQAYGELRKAFAALRPDIVHTHTSKAGIVGRQAARAVKVPHIVHGVHMLPFSNVGAVERFVYLAAEHAVAPGTDLFVHVSHGTKQAYETASIGRKVPHRVVRSGMEIGKFRDAPWPDDWRDMLRIGPDEEKPSVILMLAALEPRKRHIDFLEGFAAATRPGEPIRLIFAGDGPDREAVHQKVADLGLADRVVLLGYYPTPERVVALSDIGVLASLREGLPRVVVQYLGGGKPAVVSPVEAIEEIVQHGVNGRIVPSPDAAEVARVAVDLIRDRSELARLSAGAAVSPVDEWSFPAMFAALDASYESLPVPARR